MHFLHEEAETSAQVSVRLIHYYVYLEKHWIARSYQHVLGTQWLCFNSFIGVAPTLIFRLPYCHHISPYNCLGKSKGENFLESRQSAQPGHDACSLPRWKSFQPVWILVLGHRQTGEGRVQMFRHLGRYPGHCTSLPPKQKILLSVGR